MSIYDIYIAYVSWGESGKRRPVLILEQSTNGVTIFNITTRYDGKSENIRNKFFKINDWQQAGLNQESYIDTNRVVTLPHTSVAQSVGTLSGSDIQRFVEFLST